MKPSTRRVLSALQAAGDRGCTTHDLCQPDVGGIRFSARLLELRQDGYRIRVYPLRPGRYLYVLVDPPGLGEAA